MAQHLNNPACLVGGTSEAAPVALDTITSMRERLAVLEPDALEIYDESREHTGHAGAQSGGGHFQLIIVSRRFEGRSRVARHRMVYAALSGLMQSRIHALAITAWTPQEAQTAFGK